MSAISSGLPPASTSASRVLPHLATRFLAGARTNDRNLFDTCYTILLLEGLGGLEDLGQDELHMLGGSVQRFQGSDTGLFTDPRTDTSMTRSAGYHAYRATHLAIQSLDALGLRPVHPLPRCSEFGDQQAVTSWLDGLDWTCPRLAAEEVTFHLGLLVYEAEVEEVSAAPQLLHTVLDWLDRAQDRVSGLWGWGLSARSYDAVIAAHRLLPFYEYVHRPVNRAGRLTDWLLELLELGDPFGGGPELPLAVAGLLATLSGLAGYRREEIKRTLLWSHEATLTGLCEDMDGSVEDSWLRMLTLAIIAGTYPNDLTEPNAWQFRRWPGVGHHRSGPGLDQHERDVLRTWLRSPAHAVSELPAGDVPAISVVIPCYNLGRYLCEAIDSVLAQTLQSFEIIVVDDGSTDDYTRTLLRRLERPRTRIIHQDNAGVGAARNRGIREARGDYICCLDADDRFQPSYFAQALPVLTSQADVALVTSNYLSFDDVDHVVEHHSCKLPEILMDSCAMQASLFKRSAWERVGGYCETFSVTGIEDWDLWLRMLRAGYRAAVVPEVLFEYRVRPQSMSATMLRPENVSRMLDELVERNRRAYEAHVKDVYVRSRVEAYALRAWSETTFRALQRTQAQRDLWRARYEEEAAKQRAANGRLARIDASTAGRLYRRAKGLPGLRALAERSLRPPPREDER